MGKEETIGIHNRKHRVKSAYRLLDEYGQKGKTEQGNKELILDFVRHKKTAQGIGELREAKTITTLRIIAELWDRPFCELKPKRRGDKDLEDARKRLEYLLDKAYNRDIFIKNQAKKKPKPATCKDFYIFLKMFYCYLIGRKHPKEFDWIGIPKAPPKKPKVRELLTMEDIELLCSAGKNERDVLMPLLFFSVGGRVEEIISLRLEDIEPVDDGEYYLIHLNRSKRDVSGNEAIRSVAVDDVGPSLTAWINKHPLRGNKKSPLFVSLGGEHKHLDYANVRKILIKLRERTGIKKSVHPHNFRKSATHYLRNRKKMNDASLKTRHGWLPSSTMLNVYSPVDQEEANKDFLRIKGKLKDKDKPKEDTIKPKTCKYCLTKNPIGSGEYCINPRCRRPLNVDINKARTEIEDKSKVREIVMEAITEMIGKGDMCKALKGLDITGKV